MYTLIKNFLFLLSPEQSHIVALNALNICYKLGLTKFLSQPISNPITIMGINFPNHVGLAAGLDKNADYVEALASLGFGFIEIGTVTPKPQSGNPKPRLFRLIKQQALINRMGFNSKGADYVAKQLAKINYNGVLGINIAKNKDTPLDQAINDYLICFRKLWKFASYITINISSPNTPGLRDLQQNENLHELLSVLKQEQQTIKKMYDHYVPLVVKISPDISQNELKAIAKVLVENRMDGVIATNTTLSREKVVESKYSHEAGGLSGKPLQSASTEVIKILKQQLQNKIPIIGVGGIDDYTSAQEKINAGASLLQIYTGFIYKGPRVIREISDVVIPRFIRGNHQ